MVYFFCSCVRTLMSYTAGNHRHGWERDIGALVLMQGPQHTLADTSWPLIASLYAMVYLSTEQELN